MMNRCGCFIARVLGACLAYPLLFLNSRVTMAAFVIVVMVLRIMGVGFFQELKP